MKSTLARRLSPPAPGTSALERSARIAPSRQLRLSAPGWFRRSAGLAGAASLSAVIATLPVGGTLPIAAAGAGDGWTSPTTVADSLGWTQFQSATAPNGATAVVWIEPGTSSGTKIMAAVNPVGDYDWLSVPATVDNADVAGTVSLSAAPHGSFWATWAVDAGAGAQSVEVSRLNPRTQLWSEPTEPFSALTVTGDNPAITVAGDGTIAVSTTVTTADDATATVVATRNPGQQWTTETFEDSTRSAVAGQAIAAGPDGQLLVAWDDQVYDGTVLQGTQTMVASRSASSAEWNLSEVSDVGTVTTPVLALGTDGTAAVVWRSFGAGSDLVAATAEVGAAEPTWVSTEIVSNSTDIMRSPKVAVSEEGIATVVWSDPGTSGKYEVQARNLDGAVLGETATLSASGATAYPVSLSTRNDGEVDVLFHQTSTANGSTGLRLVPIQDGVPGGTASLSGTSDGDVWTTIGTSDASIAAALGTDAARKSTVVFGRSDAGVRGFIVEFKQQLGKPTAMTSAFSGVQLNRALLHGKARIGETLRCGSGYWVGAKALRYRWLRGGDFIRSQAASLYQVTSDDLGQALQCRVIATNDSLLKRVLTSLPKRVP